MPSRQTLDAFVAHVISGDHVGAIERYYTDDASMQENNDPPRVGREVLMAGEAKVLARVERVTTELMGPALIDGDQVAIRWRFEFFPKAGPSRVIEEVAWQTWRGEKIAREAFFYDPKQMTA